MVEMTTLREICNIDDVPKEMVEYFIKNKGQVPLCCFDVKKSDSRLLITCGWLKEWLDFEDFRVKCLKCQEEISEKLRKVE